jgi:hypothetical protein
MSFFVFRTQGSTGARELADALGGSRLRRFEGGRFFRTRNTPNPVTVRPGDVIVNWGGGAIQVPQGVKTLNNTAINSKYNDALKLKAAGVATVEVSKTRPNVQAAPAVAAVDPAIAFHGQLIDQLEDLVEAPFARNAVFQRGLNEVQTKLAQLIQALNTPVPAARPAQQRADETWVGRVNDHIGGTDLLTPPPAPDYFVKKLDIVEEYRLHMFQGKSIRAGVKKHRENFPNPSPWVRSYDGGWRIVYDGFESKKAMRELAAKAVETLGLEFGAVDLGKLADGSYIVLEVNRAPGLEGGTVNSYSNAITAWAAGNFGQRAEGQQRRRRAA